MPDQKIPKKLDYESDLDHAWFKLFCLLGYDRNLPKVVDLLLESNPKNDRKKLYKRVAYIAAKHDWARRCQQFDLDSLSTQLDRAIKSREEIESNWVDRYSSSLSICQQIARDNEKAFHCNSLILDAVATKLAAEKDTRNLPRWQKIVAEIVVSNQKILQLKEGILEFKDNADALAIGRQHLLESFTQLPD